MTYEHHCTFCGCLWSAIHASNRCPDCSSSDFDSGDFPEDNEYNEDNR